MKKLLLSVVGMLFAATSFAQNTLVASLSHGETVTYFYGGKALQQAVAAAASGDIITLSEGIFEAVNIEKAIVLRGVGIDIENPTYINGEFYIDIPSSDANQFTMEGITCQEKVTIKGTFSNPYFVKSYVLQIAGNDETDAVSNIMIVNCKVPNGVGVRGTSSVYLVNSFSGDIGRAETATVTATNCVLCTYPAGGRFDNSQLYNCILYCPGSSENGLSGTCKAYNCITTRVGPSSRYWYNIFHSACVNCTFDVENVFTDTDTFEINDVIKENYKGTDGTEVGIYGGLQPYNATPSYPVIKSLDVDSQTDSQGKLNATVKY